MCTVVVLRRPEHRWPLLWAANRDEMQGRPWLPPGRHWPERPDVVAGLDRLAGGSWLGINDQGVVAAMLNRMGTLGPEAGKRSRGELVLEALDHTDAVDAAQALSQLDPQAYRPFNMLIGDNRDAFWLRADGAGIRVVPLAEGLSMLTAFELNDRADPRIDNFLPRFEQAPPPDPDRKDWHGWQTLMASTAPAGTTAGASQRSMNREAALCFQLDNGFGTRSSALLALPSVDHPELDPVFLFSPGPPGQAPYRPVVV
ncbi:MAG TPA: hypothetical protein HPQ04_13680 [Rhodospirillaceae bacterium]|nr:hypothetical protein [Rhodospirillaceae bacterium]